MKASGTRVEKDILRKLKETYQLLSPSWQQVVVFVDVAVWSVPSSHQELAYLCKIGGCKFIFVKLTGFV